MIVVCDINELWRRKPFAAMAGLADVLGVSPRDWFLACRPSAADDGLETFRTVLPPGWASLTGWMGQPMLWRRIAGECRRRGAAIDGLVVTSPHYLALLGSLPRGLPLFYYASDDYRVYKGWHRMEQLENQLVRRVDHAFFVSRGLAERAVREYGADPARVSVSMNATEPRFFAPPGSPPCEPPSGPLPRPIAAVVGVVSDRLDFDLLLQCADLPALGTLLLAGPLPCQPSAALQRLLAHPKCAAVGAQPHGEIHRWFHCLDVGLLPFARGAFNRMCSPMRLFDHLASGAPVVATAVCEQVAEFGPPVAACGSAASFLAALEERLAHPPPRQPLAGIAWQDRAQQLLKTMEGVRLV